MMYCSIDVLPASGSEADVAKLTLAVFRGVLHFDVIAQVEPLLYRRILRYIEAYKDFPHGAAD